MSFLSKGYPRCPSDQCSALACKCAQSALRQGGEARQKQGHGCLVGAECMHPSHLQLLVQLSVKTCVAHAWAFNVPGWPVPSAHVAHVRSRTTVWLQIWIFATRIHVHDASANNALVACLHALVLHVDKNNRRIELMAYDTSVATPAQYAVHLAARRSVSSD